jgi:hypothetical protein
MSRFFATVVACVLLSGFSTGIASAKPCRDAHGKFVKCPTMHKQCRDAKGKFVKCPPMKKM